jgi:hypothetical protein
LRPPAENRFTGKVQNGIESVDVERSVEREQAILRVARAT